MITATISGAQLDTIDVDELVKIVEVAHAVERLEDAGRRMYGVGFLGTSARRFEMHALVGAFVAASGAPAQTLQVPRAAPIRGAAVHLRAAAGIESSRTDSRACPSTEPPPVVRLSA